MPEPVELHYPMPEEKPSTFESSDKHGVTTIQIPPIQIDEEVFIEVEPKRETGTPEQNSEQSKSSKKRAPAPPPPISPELEQELRKSDVKYTVKQISPNSQSSDALKDLGSTGTVTPQPTREQPPPPQPIGIVVEVHPNHPAIREKRERTEEKRSEYLYREERIIERREEYPSVSPMPQLPAMRVTIDRRAPSPPLSTPPPSIHSPAARVPESRREYSRDTTERTRTIVRTKEIVRENAPILSEEERMLQDKYDHLKAKFDRWQYLKSTDRENPETKKLQAELMIEHDRVVALLSSLYPADSAPSTTLSKASPRPRNGVSSSRQHASPPRRAPESRKTREAPAPISSSPTPSSSGLSSTSSTSSPKYTRDLNDNLIPRSRREKEKEEQRRSEEKREERRPKSLLIPAPDYDTSLPPTVAAVNYHSTLNQSEFFGPAIPYYDTRARGKSTGSEHYRKQSTDSYSSSTIGRTLDARTQFEWEAAAQRRAEEEMRTKREADHRRKISAPSSQSSSSSSSTTYLSLSSAKSSYQSGTDMVVRDAARLSSEPSKHARRISRESPPVQPAVNEYSLTPVRKQAAAAPPPPVAAPIPSAAAYRPAPQLQQEHSQRPPRLQEAPRQEVIARPPTTIARPNVLPPSPPVISNQKAEQDRMMRPTPVKVTAAPPPPAAAVKRDVAPAAREPAAAAARDVPVKMVGPVKQARPAMTPIEELSLARLNKVGPPREQNVVALGRVIDSPSKTLPTPPPAPPLPPSLPSISSPISSPSTGGPPPPPPPPPMMASTPRSAITADALRSVQLKSSKDRPLPSSPRTPTTPSSGNSLDLKDQLMAEIKGGVKLRKVNSPAKAQ